MSSDLTIEQMEERMVGNNLHTEFPLEPYRAKPKRRSMRKSRWANRKVKFEKKEQFKLAKKEAMKSIIDKYIVAPTSKARQNGISSVPIALNQEAEQNIMLEYRSQVAKLKKQYGYTND